MQDIHGIRPPVMVGTDPALVKLALIVGGVAAVLLILFLAVRYFLKKRNKTDIPELIPSVPPYDRALEELDRMAATPVSDPRAFYFQLGRTVKAYMAQVFDSNCLEMTTPELSRTVKGLDLPRDLSRNIIGFQEVCDPFRYAPENPCADQVKTDLARARALVQEIEGRLNREKEAEGEGV